MKYIKTYEKLTKSEEEKVIDKIKSIVNEITYDQILALNNGQSIDDTPFDTELALIFQQDYIEDMYLDVTNWPKDLSLEDFKKIYSKLLEKAPITILAYLENDPTLYDDYLDDYLEVPEWIKKAGKYNL
jgi:hypothetical protein